MASLKDHLKKLVIAASYAFLSAVSVNLFWVPGGIYANGVTGFAQLVVALSGKFHLPMLDLATLVLLINVPLLVIAWFKIDRKFTIFTIIAVFLTSVFMKVIPVMALTNDPVICTVFGGVIHGLGVGITLNSDFSTGGLDIIGILVRKVTTRSIGTIFTAFNLAIEFIAGFVFGWRYALYSAITVFINGKVVDFVNTKERKVQLLIVTKHANEMLRRIQDNHQSGITVINHAQGGYYHESQDILLLVVTSHELNAISSVVKKVDQLAFMSITKGIETNRSTSQWG
ncbi:MAG: YitT family protein [Lactococcus raffinolactis]|nr:YitT family protein [Lactococcus raffinolactis]MDN5415352.1 YitT family protein [Lactococcus raffinolactis]MDN5473037.1 YitT family protein [Lactococcus raffinolactis]MDN5495361.1 YitT family protein [Lactococcus raffinolactis]MDN5579457.1 YitT family protein [Lactococcus raffinolactis]